MSTTQETDHLVVVDAHHAYIALPAPDAPASAADIRPFPPGGATQADVAAAVADGWRVKGEKILDHVVYVLLVR